MEPTLTRYNGGFPTAKAAAVVALVAGCLAKQWRINNPVAPVLAPEPEADVIVRRRTIWPLLRLLLPLLLLLQLLIVLLLLLLMLLLLRLQMLLLLLQWGRSASFAVSEL